MLPIKLTVLPRLIGLIACLGVWSPLVGTAHPPASPPPPRQANPKPTQPPKSVRPPSPKGQHLFKALIDSLLNRLKRQEQPLGSRGRICAIAPGLLGKTDTIWSDRPLFLWQGEADQIVLRQEDTNAEVWRQSVVPNTRQLAYSGDDLQPDQVYIWELVNASQLQRRYTFAVMPATERQQLWDQLQNLAAAEEAETMAALRRADYFGQQGLWSDALQTLYGIKNPPAEVAQSFEVISAFLCQGKAAISQTGPEDAEVPQ